MIDDAWMLVCTLGTSMTIGALVFRVMLIKHNQQEDPLPVEVYEKANEIVNETLVVRASLKKLARAPDPLQALIFAMKGKKREINLDGDGFSR